MKEKGQRSLDLKKLEPFSLGKCGCFTFSFGLCLVGGEITRENLRFDQNFNPFLKRRVEISGEGFGGWNGFHISRFLQKSHVG